MVINKVTCPLCGRSAQHVVAQLLPSKREIKTIYCSFDGILIYEEEIDNFSEENTPSTCKHHVPIADFCKECDAEFQHETEAELKGIREMMK